MKTKSKIFNSGKSIKCKLCIFAIHAIDSILYLNPKILIYMIKILRISHRIYFKLQNIILYQGVSALKNMI